jgi:FkbM family methyltransferase
MLIRMQELKERHGCLPSGVIHIGAHLGEELKDYLDVGAKNILWVEANPKIYRKLCQNVLGHVGSRCMNALVSDSDGKECLFRITNNGESSSMLPLKEHLVEHPHIFVEEIIKLRSARFDTLCEKEQVNLKLYDFINLDIQGAELMALQGMGQALKQARYIYLEVNIRELYEGCAFQKEIENYLNQFKSHSQKNL